MNRITDYPLLVFVVSFLVLWLSTWIGRSAPRRPGKLDSQSREDFAVVLPASLTLLGLIIGFTFSMAGGHYDQRRSYEETEANAIGTEYLRADLLPAAEASQVHALLSRYLHQRILFYSVRDEVQLGQINVETSRLQAELWSTVQAPATAQMCIRDRHGNPMHALLPGGSSGAGCTTLAVDPRGFHGIGRMQQVAATHAAVRAESGAHWPAFLRTGRSPGAANNSWRSATLSTHSTSSLRTPTAASTNR